MIKPEPNPVIFSLFGIWLPKKSSNISLKGWPSGNSGIELVLLSTIWEVAILTTEGRSFSTRSA